MPFMHFKARLLQYTSFVGVFQNLLTQVVGQELLTVKTLGKWGGSFNLKKCEGISLEIYRVYHLFCHESTQRTLQYLDFEQEL